LKIHSISSYIANIYVIETGQGVVMVDTGFSQTTRRVKQQLAQRGLAGEQIRLIVLTHAHVDHLGGAAEFRRWSGAPIALHSADNEKAIAGTHTLPSGRGVFGRVLERGSNALGLRFRYEPFRPDIFLQEGQSLAAFGLDAKVHSTPGHTMGSISLELPDGSMIIGDAVINQLRVGMSLYGEANSLAYDSALKILSLRPRVLYSGHGKPFSGTDLQRYFEKKSKALEASRSERVQPAGVGMRADDD
jgi:glyoxylase-like metal-dependent hydrolase (beta-lactamase superfamily II)